MFLDVASSKLQLGCVTVLRRDGLCAEYGTEAAVLLIEQRRLATYVIESLTTHGYFILNGDLGKRNIALLKTDYSVKGLTGEDRNI
jgi:hypothetical protein